jgi:hypothetical protein
MMQEDEWACFWVDDLIDVTAMPNQQNYNGVLGVTMATQPEYRQLLKTPCDADMFFELCKETISEAESKGFALCAFSLTDNPLFRNNHYGYWGYADGRCWLVKKTRIRFDTNVHAIDDACWTAQNLKEFGGVVINNWVLPKCERYSAGGFGSKEQRMEQKIQECKYLVETYPEYIAYADKVGFPTGSHIKIRQKKTNKSQVNLF